MKRQLYIFNGFEHGDQVVELKNEADIVGTPVRKLGFGKCGDIDITHMNTTLIRLVDSGDQVEERGFTGTGWPHQRQEFAFGNIKRDIIQDGHNQALPVIGFVEISYFNDSAFLLRHNLLSVIAVFSILFVIPDTDRESSIRTVRGTVPTVHLSAILIFDPSFNPLGGLMTTRSPGFSPALISIISPSFSPGWTNVCLTLLPCRRKT